MAGLTAAQVKMLEGLPGIDQNLLAAYKSNPAVNATYKQTLNAPTTPAKKTPLPSAPTITSPEDAASRINNYNAALNTAIDQARQQRQDKTMDFMNGVVPAGALKATSFAGVLSAFNSDSAPLEAALINNASDFAQQAAEMELKTKNAIYELSLEVAKNGNSEAAAAVATFAQSGDMQGAIKAASAALGEEYIEMGGNLVKIDKTTGEYEIIISDPNPKGGSKTTTTDGAVPGVKDWEVTNPLPDGVQGPVLEISGMDFYSAKTADIDREMSRVLGDKSPAIKKALTSELQKDFMNDWVYMQEMSGRPMDPWTYYTDMWAPAAGIVIKDEKDDSKSDVPEKRTPLAN